MRSDCSPAKRTLRPIDPAAKFYTEVLDFEFEQKTGTAFAMVSRGPLQLGYRCGLLAGRRGGRWGIRSIQIAPIL
jgi:hypothetical protein